MLTLQKVGHRELERYYSLMEIDFDSEELLSKLAIHRGMMNGSVELLVLRDDQSRLDAAYALVLTKNLYGYVDLKYFAVMPWFRGRGFGVQLMRELHKRYADTQGVIAELTEFDDPDPDRLRKLKKFFARFGYEPLACACTVSGVRDNLLVKQLKGSADLSPVIHRVLPDFYRRFLSDTAIYNLFDFTNTKQNQTEL